MKRALIAALGLLAVPLFSLSVLAADLGGNCCADLEERVAELEATAARKGNRVASLTISGQVNKAIIFWDSGAGWQKSIIDNDNAQSRFNFRGEAKVNADLTVGYVMEIGVNENGGVDSDDGAFKVRHSAIYFRSKAGGTLTLGQYSRSSDGAAEMTLSSAGIAARMMSFSPFGSDMPFDGGRAQIVRYDTGLLSGFTASASWGADNVWDAAIRYAGEFGGLRIAGAGYYRDEDALATAYGISGSLMHLASGLFASGSYGVYDLANVSAGDLKGWHAQAGWEGKVDKLGKLTLFGEFARLETSGAPNTDLMGLGVVKGLGFVDVYLSARRIDDGVTSDVVVIGSRVKF